MQRLLQRNLPWLLCWLTKQIHIYKKKKKKKNGVFEKMADKLISTLESQDRAYLDFHLKSITQKYEKIESLAFSAKIENEVETEVDATENKYNNALTEMLFKRISAINNKDKNQELKLSIPFLFIYLRKFELCSEA
jgi:predicted nucleotide-binding protein (sugar kinase/HSP70/actin superfamily)